MNLTRRSFAQALAAAALIPATPGVTLSSSVTLSLSKGGSYPDDAAAQIRNEFFHAWLGYKTYAWGFDELMPLSAKGSNFFLPNHAFGLSIIEALDTLYVMGFDDELEHCVEWLRKNMHFDVDGDVQMFEAVIRMVAGLIAGYYATNEKFLLEGARDLADRLLPCFTKSHTGAPYRYANLRTGAVHDPQSNLAEIGSNVLEFGDLSRLTGDPKYLNASMKAYEAVIARRSKLNLLGTYFDIERGAFTSKEDVAPDEPADSFYEYLWGGWQMLHIAKCRDWYRLLTEAILKYKPVHENGHLWFATVDYTTGVRSQDGTVTELSAFYAELVAKGGDRAVGEAFFDSWTAVAEKYGLIPEEINRHMLSVVDPRYWMRPEYANSAFDLWFLTHDEKYRRAAWKHFEVVRANCRVPNGYTVLLDIRTRPMKPGDTFPAYAFSENFKYLYLMFADSPRFDGNNYYLNTEGKILRGLRGHVSP